jgi:SAM-dependent methyltransferase
MPASDRVHESPPASSADFEIWSDSYREEVERVVKFSGQSAQYFTKLKARALIDLARRRVGDPAGLTALDVGCGVGVTDRYLVGAFGRTLGVDIFEGVLDAATAANPDVEYRLYDGNELPFPDASIDIAFAICVLHHVPPARWAGFTAEMARVLRPGGIAAIFEHNPINPLTRRVVADCVFDEDAVLLRRRTATALLCDSGLRFPEHRYIAFLPFGGHRVAPIEAAMRRIPLGAQYYVAAARA